MPEALVTYDSKDETSTEAKRFCVNIDTTLKTPEQGMSWAKIAELHIGILKSSVSKHVT